MGRGIELAVLGAVGLNGDNVLQLIGERELPVSGIRVLDSDDYLGRKVDFGGKLLTLDSYNNFSFSEIDLAIACGETPAGLLEQAMEQGCTVIGPDSAFPDSQPIVADVELDRLGLGKGDFHAVPTALSSVLASILSPLHDEAGVTAVEATWISAVGNHGRTAIEGLAHETTQLLSGKSAAARAFKEKIAFNMLSIDGDRERQAFKSLWQSLWGDEVNLNLNVVIAPLFFGDMLSLSIEIEQSMPLDELQQVLASASWIKQQSSDGDIQLSSASTVGSDHIAISELRPLDNENRRFSLLAAVDAPRFGFALNITKLTEYLAKKLFISYS